MKIFDCFRFFNEKELLELKYHILKDHVDKFIVLEGTKTFSGNPWEPLAKKFINELNLPEEKFIILETYLPGDDEKIENSEVDVLLKNHSVDQTHVSYQDALNARTRERMQMDALLSIIDQFEEDDIFIVSDTDEIINPDYIPFFSKMMFENAEFLIRVLMVQLQGRATLRAHHTNTQDPIFCAGMYMCSKQHFKTCSPAQLRYNLHSQYSDGFITQDGEMLKECGWHFTWMGGPKRVKLRLHLLLTMQMPLDQLNHLICYLKKIILILKIGNLEKMFYPHMVVLILY